MKRSVLNKLTAGVFRGRESVAKRYMFADFATDYTAHMAFFGDAWGSKKDDRTVDQIVESLYKRDAAGTLWEEDE